MGKFQILVERYISLEKSYQDLFSGKVFQNVDLNYYHQKHQTWYLSMK